MAEDFDPYFKWLGIPPEHQPPHHYRLLGVPEFTDDADVISHAVDRLMTHLRTFQSGPKSAHSQKLLNEISAARVCLLNAENKAAYDQQLRLELDAQQQPADISAEVSDSSPTPPFSSPESSMATVDLPTTPQIRRTGGPTVAGAKYRHQRRKKNKLPVVVVLGLMVVAILLLGIVLFNLLSNPSESPGVLGGQKSGTAPAAATAAQKRKLADIDRDGNGKVTREEYVTAQGREFERRDKDQDGVLSENEFPAVTLIDTNGDGKLDRDEYNTRMEVDYDTMDKNEDGVLTADEM